MKKLLSSLPSTKPDHFCQSQSSQLETIKNPKPNYTLQLQSLLASMAEVVKIRSVLLPRDIEAIFDEHQQFFSQFLEVQSKSQLWQLVADKRETELNEQKQISLLIKILQKLNKKRLQAADSGDSYLSDQLRKIVDWFINEILKYQSSVALKKQSQAISRLSEKGKLRRLSYQVQEKRMIQSFQESDKARQEKMLNRFKREQQFRQMQVGHKINDEIYKFNPSALTKQVKSKSLMRKLGPYRMNKSNPYEDKGYVTDINHTLHEEEARRMTVIDHYKKVERQKLVKQQSNLFETQKIHWDHQRNKMHTTLDKGRTELEYNQQKIKENMIHSFEMSRKRKLGELKKTLDAYVKHEDSIKIKEVMTEHEEKIRHTADLREIGLPQSILKHIPGRYATICGKAEHSGESQARRHERFFESRIHKIMRQQSQQRQLLAGRKSLVDMYDNSLMPV